MIGGLYTIMLKLQWRYSASHTELKTTIRKLVQNANLLQQPEWMVKR